MKYRLKKDLPFAKAGAEVMLEEYPSNYIAKHWVVRIDEDKARYRGMRQHIGEEDWDMSEWIEEVKPREWWLINDCHIGITTGFNSESLAQRYKSTEFNSSQKEIVHVKEVI